jgi:hypothetical protein
MPVLKKYVDRLQTALGKKNTTGKNCVDKIDTQLWTNEVIPTLDKVSSECADELQEKTGKPYPKDTTLTFKEYFRSYHSCEIY